MTDVNINGTLKPTQAGTPTHVDDLGVGGWRSVATTVELNTIAVPVKSLGMSVFVRQNETLYTWDGLSWINPILFGGDIDFSAATDGQTIIYNEVDAKWELGITEFTIPTGSIHGSKIINYSIQGEQLAYPCIETNHLNSSIIAYDNLTPSCVHFDNLDETVTDEFPTHNYLIDNYAPLGSSLPLTLIFETPSGDGYPGDVGFVAVDDTHMYICLSADESVPQQTTWKRIVWDSTWP